ncbi:MAG: L,D-transpeptidase [Rhizobiales bacterium]|nr:L,D-transpeptidase [Hyphomicrobiales bacterium]
MTSKKTRFPRISTAFAVSALAVLAATSLALAPTVAKAENSGGFAKTSVFGFNFFKTTAPKGKVVAKIDLSDQRMNIYVNGRRYHTFKVSTARRGYVTPTGSWRPTRLHEMWHSRKYDMSPMPHSVFFKGGYAVHGTNSISRLGSPASHGCIRLHPADARTFYNMVKSNGMRNTTVKIVH